MRNTPHDTLKDHQVTPESVYRQRRRLLTRSIALAPLALAACGRDGGPSTRAPKPTLAIAERGKFSSKEKLTSWRDITHYNNYYEFGTGKNDPARHSGRFLPRPWSVEIAGEAERTGTVSLEEIFKQFPLEQRIYRHRCVEAWSMVIPWVGIPLAKIIKRLRPTSRAKFVAFTTVDRPRQMPGLAYPVLDWPYREGLRIDEAMHPLTFLAVGVYGNPLPNQNGAPLRLVVPWKYGFKSIKSIVRIEFTETRPPTSWNRVAPNEYGFYSNVNPDVDHVRWSQASERRIAGDDGVLFGQRIATRLFNGYAEQVASLYAGMDLRRYF